MTEDKARAVAEGVALSDDIYRAMLAAAPASPASQPGEPVAEDALQYATRLVMSIAEYHYPDRVPEWKPLPDLIGVLTQIDNMVSGMCRKPEASITAAVRAEREECAKVAEALPRKPDPLDGGRHWDEAPRMIDPSAREIAAAIRQRDGE